MNFQLAMAFLQAVLGVVSNTTLSQGKKDNALAYVGLLGALVQAGTDVNKALAELTERVKTHEPITDAELDTLKARSDKAHSEIQNPSE